MENSVSYIDERFKVCGHCRKVQDISSFHLDTSRKDGLSIICKTCSDAWDAKHTQKWGDN